MTPAVAAILVNYNAGNELRLALQSIADEFHGRVWEAVVIDNASSDGSAAIAEAFAPQVRLLRNAQNVVICAGEDLNRDGIVQAGETNPSAVDTDSDGIIDGLEGPRCAATSDCLGGDVCTAGVCQPADALVERRPDPRNTDSEHKGIVDAVLARDTEKAVRLLDQHLRHTARRLIDRVSHPDPASGG